jgi:hypothetical protein
MPAFLYNGQLGSGFVSVEEFASKVADHAMGLAEGSDHYCPQCPEVLRRAVVKAIAESYAKSPEMGMGVIVAIATAAVSLAAKFLPGLMGGGPCSGSRHAQRAAWISQNNFSWMFDYEAAGNATAKLPMPDRTYPFPNPINEEQKNANRALYIASPTPGARNEGCVEHGAAATWLKSNLPRLFEQQLQATAQQQVQQATQTVATNTAATISSAAQSVQASGQYPPDMIKLAAAIVAQQAGQQIGQQASGIVKVPAGAPPIQVLPTPSETPWYAYAGAGAGGLLLLYLGVKSFI